MNDLNKLINKKNKAVEKGRKPQKDSSLPVYDMKGRTVFSEQSVRRKKAVIAGIAVAGVAAFLYLPQLFLSSPASSDDPIVETDQSAIRMVNNALRDHPTADFDGDGIENADEVSLGTDPWDIDTDKDNVTDYYEVNVLDSDPLSPGSALLDAQTKQDGQSGKNLGTPYKIGDVILWPADYESRAYGSVVETPKGYRICGFQGYAQFPESAGDYAYKVEDGIHTMLPYREAENAWQVADGNEIEIYTEKLDGTVRIGFFGKRSYIQPNPLSKAIAFILPDRGFLTATGMMAVDAEPDTSKDVTAEIQKPLFDSDDYARFTMNSNTLNNLLFVRQAIEEDGCCIAVSLFNADRGEYLGIIYGYTADGDLLVADMDTLEPVGKIQITEMARKLLNNEGDIVSNTYFDFYGFGFDSAKGDRISFFAASEGSGETEEINNMLKSETVRELEEKESKEATEEEAAPEGETLAPGTGDSSGLSGQGSVGQQDLAQEPSVQDPGSGSSGETQGAASGQQQGTVQGIQDSSLQQQPSQGTQQGTAGDSLTGTDGAAIGSPFGG